MLDGSPRLDGLAAVDWSALTHAYGPATDVPELLRRAAAASAEEADAATRAVLEGTPPERVAAGLALVQLRRPWPDGAIAAVVTALGGDARLPHPWVEDPVIELMVEADDELAQALLAALATSLQARLRREAVWGMTARGDAWRGAGGPAAADEDCRWRSGRERLRPRGRRRALWRLGVPPAELTAILVEAIQDYWNLGDPIAVLVEMGAVGAAPELERLADQPRRIQLPGLADDVVWSDEALQTRLRAAAATLRGIGGQHSPSAST